MDCEIKTISNPTDRLESSVQGSKIFIKIEKAPEEGQSVEWSKYCNMQHNNTSLNKSVYNRGRMFFLV